MSKIIYALGFFDGVHIGHTQLLLQCHSLAYEHDCTAGVVTFGSHPETLVQGNAPGSSTPSMTGNGCCGKSTPWKRY